MFNHDTIEVSAEMKALLRDTVSNDPSVSSQAKQLLVAALTKGQPIRSGVMYGDIVSDIFTQERFEPGIPIEYPFDVVQAADVKLHIAYSTPWTGALPKRMVEADYIAVKTFMVGTSIGWSREMARNMRWNVAARAMQVAEGGLIRKRNNDGWHTLLTAGNDRGVAVNDSTATSGLFTKRLISLMQTLMRRYGGGNSTSLDKGRLTHGFLSPEGLQDVRSWDLTQVDDITRREIFLGTDDIYTLTRIFGVTLVDIDELGVGQEYQNYFSNTLGGTISGSKPELVVGLDLGQNHADTFVMPWVPRENGQFVEMLEDPMAITFNRVGWEMRARYGCAVLDNRRIVLAGF